MNKTIELNALKDRIHSNNKHWWTNLHTGEPIKRDRRELLALVVSEVVEALEGERKNLMDDKLLDRPMAEVEMADAWIRLADLAGGYGIELEVRDHWFDISDNKAVALFRLMELVVRSQAEDHIISTCMAYIRAYCERFDYDLDGAIEAKLEYNKHRADHKPENRLLVNGKKW